MTENLRRRERAARRVLRRGCGLAVLAGCLMLAGCGGPGDDEVVLVFAASSLIDAIVDLEATFEQNHPGTDVVVNVSGSARLREQILEGAPADVFAAASPLHTDMVVDEGLALDEAVVFARNPLAVVTPVGNPGGVGSFEQLASDPVLVGLCAAAVPCGSLARQLLEIQGVVASVDTEEPNVRALLSKLEAGELDVGIVYRSDVADNDRVEVVALDTAGVYAEYPAVALRGGDSGQRGEDFVEFLAGAEARRILVAHGFEAP